MFMNQLRLIRFGRVSGPLETPNLLVTGTISILIAWSLTTIHNLKHGEFGFEPSGFWDFCQKPH